MDNLATSVLVFKFFSFQLFSPSFKGNSYTDFVYECWEIIKRPFRLSNICGLNRLPLQLSGKWQHGCQSATEMSGGWTTDQNIK